MIQAPQPPYKRYTVRPFPPYRFIPGINPHPTENPLGHSYGEARREPIPLTITNWHENEEYLFGVDLYNYAFWWEAYEVFEGLWKLQPRHDLTSQFLQGLIKISGAFLKWHQKERRGLIELYNSGTTLLKNVLSEKTIYMGIDLMEYLAGLNEGFLEVVSEEEIWPDPYLKYPFLNLKI